MILIFSMANVFVPVNVASAQSHTVHFICSTMNRGDQGSITFLGTTYYSGQSASYAQGDYWVTANPPSPTTDWSFYRWQVLWLGSQSWVDNEYSQSTWFHLRGEAYLKAEFYSPIHANNPTSPITWGTRMRITGTASQHSGQQLNIVYYSQGSGMGPPNRNGVPPFGGSGYQWTTATVSSGSWDTGWIYPTLPVSLGHELPQTYDVYACWASGSVNEVDSNVVSFTLNPASAQIAAPTLTPNNIELEQPVTITGQIFSSDYVNQNDLTGTLTVQVRKHGEGFWTNIASQSFTSAYGYSSTYGEWGVLYDFSKTWTPTETGTYDVRVSYSGNNFYLPINNPSASILVVRAANNPPSIPTIEWITSEHILVGTPTVDEGFRSQASDPEGEDVKITFDWGDGSTYTSDWGPSGSAVEAYHSWTYPGMFEIRTKATDNHDPAEESSWSTPLEATVTTDDLWINWGGYVVESRTEPITSVEGRWTVPEFGTDLYGLQGIWVGIGGYTPSGGGPLLQAGIIAVTGYSEIHYYAFWEAVPGWGLNTDPQAHDHQILPGDTIWARVSKSDADPEKWKIEVTNLSQGWTWSPPKISPWPAPDQTTAEWIFEPGAGLFLDTNIASSFSQIVFSEARLEIDSAVYEVGKVPPSLNTEMHLVKVWRDGAPDVCTDVSPISSYSDFVISDTGSRPPALLQSITSISLLSCAELHIYDSIGNHLGRNSTSGVIDFQIPGSIYFEEKGAQYALLFNQDEYEIDLVGKENGDFHFNTQLVVNETVTCDQWFNDTITIDETITYHLFHQISLQDIESSKMLLRQGDDCSISVVAVNGGNYTENFNATVYANTTIIGTQLLTLTAEHSATIVFMWNTTGFASGNYTISAYAWPVSGETDLDDNSCIDGIVQIALPNLEVRRILVKNHGCSVYATDTYANGTGYYVPVEITVENLGLVPIESFNINLTIDWVNDSLQEDYMIWRVPSLAAGQHITLAYSWSPAHTGCYNLTVVADYDSEVTEADESDNTFVLSNYPVALMGDVNGNGLVDIMDAVVICLAWGATSSDPQWNTCADLDHNGLIDIMDAVRICLHWGQTW